MVRRRRKNSRRYALATVLAKAEVYNLFISVGKRRATVAGVLTPQPSSPSGSPRTEHRMANSCPSSPVVNLRHQDDLLRITRTAHRRPTKTGTTTRPPPTYPMACIPLTHLPLRVCPEPSAPSLPRLRLLLLPLPFLRLRFLMLHRLLRPLHKSPRPRHRECGPRLCHRTTSSMPESRCSSCWTSPERAQWLLPSPPHIPPTGRCPPAAPLPIPGPAMPDAHINLEKGKEELFLLLFWFLNCIV